MDTLGDVHPASGSEVKRLIQVHLAESPLDYSKMLMVPGRRVETVGVLGRGKSPLFQSRVLRVFQTLPLQIGLVSRTSIPYAPHHLARPGFPLLASPQLGFADDQYFQLPHAALLLCR